MGVVAAIPIVECNGVGISRRIQTQETVRDVISLAGFSKKSPAQNQQKWVLPSGKR